MKVIIFGATGGIGKWAVKHAKDKGYNVSVYVRNPDKIKDPDLNVIQGELSDYETMRDAVRGHDAVIWTVGIPLKRNYEGTASSDGHANLVKAMKETGVKRLIDWGTPSVRSEEDINSILTILPGIAAGVLYTKAKKEMVAIGDQLMSSDLDWTMVRFLAPKNSPYTGNVKVSFGDVKLNFNISREDIAAFMVEQVEETKYIHSMPIIGS